MAEFWGCRGPLNDLSFIQDHVERAVFETGATLVEVLGSRFCPYGITVVAVLSESHLSIHTWPEKRYVAVDVFTCGTKCKPQKALDHLRGVLKPRKVEVVTLSRGRKTGIVVTSFAKSGAYCKLSDE